MYIFQLEDATNKRKPFSILLFSLIFLSSNFYYIIKFEIYIYTAIPSLRAFSSLKISLRKAKIILPIKAI